MNTIMVTDKIKVEFKFYPSSGGEATYVIIYNDGVIQIRNNEEKGAVFRKKINKLEDTKIIELASKIGVDKNISTEVILDSWRIELSINDKVYYNKAGIKINDLSPEIKELLNYLIKGSTVKIDLYDFS